MRREASVRRPATSTSVLATLLLAAAIAVVAALTARPATGSGATTPTFTTEFIVSPTDTTALGIIRGAGASDGAVTAMFRLTALDSDDKPVPGLIVRATVEGATISASGGVTDAQGQFTTMIENEVAPSGDTATVTAEVFVTGSTGAAWEPASASITFGGSPAACTLTLAADSSGTTVTTLTLTDAAGNPVPDQTPVEFSAIWTGPWHTIWLDDTSPVIGAYTTVTAKGKASARLVAPDASGTVLAAAGDLICSAAVGAAAPALAVTPTPTPTPAPPAFAPLAPAAIPAPGERVTLLYSGDATLDIAALVAGLPFDVRSVARHDAAADRFDIYIPGAPARVNSLGDVFVGDTLSVARRP